MHLFGHFLFHRCFLPDVGVSITRKKAFEIFFCGARHGLWSWSMVIILICISMSIADVIDVKIEFLLDIH